MSRPSVQARYPSSSTPISAPPPANPSLPVSQLESLKFKANQIIDSIQGLQRTLEANHQPVMPAWPDILSKYNILLSQTHSFSMGLVGNPALSAGAGGRVPGGGVHGAGNMFERIALHPSVSMTDVQLDGEVIPLLRNQQTLDVLKMENETVRRLAEHMSTKGSVAVLGGAGPSSHDNAEGGSAFGGTKGKGKVEYEDVLKECGEIRSAHDGRVERAVRAVLMLKDKYDWKQRVEVEVEEPEELEWDPRVEMQNGGSSGAGDGEAGGADDRMDEGEGADGADEDADADADADADVGMDDTPEEGSSDEDEVEGALVNTAMDIHSPLSATMPIPPQNGLFGLTPASVTVTTSNPGMSMQMNSVGP